LMFAAKVPTRKFKKLRVDAYDEHVAIRERVRKQISPLTLKLLKGVTVTLMAKLGQFSSMLRTYLNTKIKGCKQLN
jgi:hypothetical protein